MGNAAFAEMARAALAYGGSEPPSPPPAEEPPPEATLPPIIFAICGGVVTVPTQVVAAELRTGPPPDRLRSLRARLEAASAAFEVLRMPANAIGEQTFVKDRMSAEVLLRLLNDLLSELDEESRRPPAGGEPAPPDAVHHFQAARELLTRVCARADVDEPALSVIAVSIIAQVDAALLDLAEGQPRDFIARLSAPLPGMVDAVAGPDGPAGELADARRELTFGLVALES